MFKDNGYKMFHVIRVKNLMELFTFNTVFCNCVAFPIRRRGGGFLFTANRKQFSDLIVVRFTDKRDGNAIWWKNRANFDDRYLRVHPTYQILCICAVLLFCFTEQLRCIFS